MEAALYTYALDAALGDDHTLREYVRRVQLVCNAERAAGHGNWQTLSGRTAMVCVAPSVYQKELADAPVIKNAGGKAFKW
jgi:hypothetical protein